MIQELKWFHGVWTYVSTSVWMHGYGIGPWIHEFIVSGIMIPLLYGEDELHGVMDVQPS